MRIIISLFILGLVVLIHEFGHFIVAKMSNMRVEKFSIGMGPAITSLKKGETTYIIGMIPAGGYVQVTGEYSDLEDDDFPDDDPRRYQNRPLLSRILFAFAGSFMNIVTAIILMIGLFMIVGVNVEIPSDEPIVANVIGDSPAALGGLLAGDRIESINGYSVTKWDDISNRLNQKKGDSFKLSILRNNQHIQVNISPKYDSKQEKYVLGVTRMVEKSREKLSFSKAFHASIDMTKKISLLVYNAVGDIVSGKTAITDKEGGLTGPVGIIKTIDNTISHGIEEIVFLISILSINLGLMNLLPFPAVDGSKILFLLIEGVRGIPIDRKKENLVNFLGFLLLMALMIYVTVNDVTNL